MQVYQYSPHSPSFYRYKDEGLWLGLGATRISRDPGLWNLAYLFGPEPESYGTDREPLVWPQAFINAVEASGGFPLKDKTMLRFAARTMPAHALVEVMFDDKNWAARLPIVKNVGEDAEKIARSRLPLCVNRLVDFDIQSRNPPIAAPPDDPERLAPQKLCGTIISMRDWIEAVNTYAK